MKSKFGKLDFKDWLKGLYLAVAAPVLGSLIDALNNGNFNFTWAFFQPYVFTGLGAAFAYILKNLLTNSKDELLTPEQ
jgi:hypothetical protein